MSNDFEINVPNGGLSRMVVITNRTGQAWICEADEAFDLIEFFFADSYAVAPHPSGLPGAISRWDIYIDGADTADPAFIIASLGHPAP